MEKQIGKNSWGITSGKLMCQAMLAVKDARLKLTMGAGGYRTLLSIYAQRSTKKRPNLKIIMSYQVRLIQMYMYRYYVEFDIM